MDLAVVINAEQALNMVTDGALFFILASGLAVIFGLMNIINFAHGSFIMVGAYAATEITQQGIDPWWGIPVAFAVGLAIGIVVELTVIRWLYGRPWDTILATIGLSLLPIAVVSIAFGKETQNVAPPLSGQWDLGFAKYSSYRMFLLIFAICLFAVLWFLTHRTRLGLIARAVVMNETLASTHGVNSRAVQRWTFVLGCGLAGLAGALVTPIAPVTPYMGENFLVQSFMVVMVAYSSVGGLALAALLLGSLQSWVTFVTDRVLLGSLSIIVLTALILRVLPQGFTTLSLPNGFQVLRLAFERRGAKGR
jgi:branched-chain amino acid transport system permease protein